MNPQFLVAGALAVLAAAIHGGLGEALIVRKLPLGELPPTRFGGPRATRVMIRAAWHIVTFTFVAFGAGLLTCGSLGGGGACQGIGIGAATSFTGFLVVSMLAAIEQPRLALRHMGPLAFLAIAVLAWWGSL